MTRKLLSLPLLAVAASCLTLAGCAKSSADKPPATATSQADAAPGSTWETIPKLPDWSGVWEPALFARPAAGGPRRPVHRSSRRRNQKQWDAFRRRTGRPPASTSSHQVANCVPPGLPGIMQQPYPIEFLFTPGRVTIITESYSMVRRVYTDGSTLPRTRSHLSGHFSRPLGRRHAGRRDHGHPAGDEPARGINGHSDKMRVTERVRLIEPDILEIPTTVEDPAVFVEPYTSIARYQRHRDWKIMEYVCAQNNHDSLDEHGNPGFSLERKPGE